MKVGREVNFYDPSHGERQTATIEKIVGTGPSLAKTLDLRVGDEVFENVPHGRDTEMGMGEYFWLLKGVEKAPQGWADKK